MEQQSQVLTLGQQARQFCSEHHAHVIPLGLLLVSHMVFSAGGLGHALVSGVISMIALRYHRKNAK